jgi:prepilin peptidase CpaA
MSVILPQFAVGLLLIAAAAADVRSLRIPNVIPLTLAALFVLTAAAGLQQPLLPHLTSFGIASVLSLALFIGNIWGGGDTKLTAAVALFLVPAELLRFALVTSVSGGLLAVALLVARHRQTAAAKTHMPYGVALAAGGLDWCVRA